MLSQVLLQRFSKTLTSGYTPLFREAFCGLENGGWNGNSCFHATTV